MTHPTAAPVLLTAMLRMSFGPDRAVVLMVRSPDASGTTGVMSSKAAPLAIVARHARVRMCDIMSMVIVYLWWCVKWEGRYNKGLVET